MRTKAKIIAYCFWFGLVILLSIYGNGVFFRVLDLVKMKILRTEIPPQIDFAITFIPWNCFISLLIWFPILLLKQRRLEAAQEIVAGGIFFFFLLTINLFGILMWCVYFPESIGNLKGGPSFSALEQYAIADGWTPLQFKLAWWIYILISTALCVGGALGAAQIKKQGILKTLSS